MFRVSLIDSILAPAFKGDKIDEQAHIDMSLAAMQLAGLSCFFKNPAFSEEKEWRIVHRPVILGKADTHKIQIMSSISSPKIRVSGASLVTYFEYEFANKNPEEIFQEIVLGPKSEVSNLDLSILLHEAGLSNITVRKSKASYR